MKLNLLFSLLISLCLISCSYDLSESLDTLPTDTAPAHYQISGKVTDQQLYPIPHIRVSLVGMLHDLPVLTNQYGDYLLLAEYELVKDELIIIFEDIDGDLNGAFQNDTLHIPIFPTDFIGQTPRFAGKVTKQCNIKLKQL